MKERTLRVLRRVQAVRVATSQRELEHARKADESLQANAARLESERAEVLDGYGSGNSAVDPRLVLHADRFAEQLAGRRRAMEPKLESTAAARAEARAVHVKALARQQLFERKK